MWRSFGPGLHPGQFPAEAEYIEIARPIYAGEKAPYQLVTGGRTHGDRSGLQVWDLQSGLVARRLELRDTRLQGFDVTYTVRGATSPPVALLCGLDGRSQSFLALRDLAAWSELGSRQLTNEPQVNCCVALNGSGGSPVAVLGNDANHNLQLVDLGTFKPLRSIQVSCENNCPRVVDLALDPNHKSLVYSAQRLEGSVAICAYDINSASSQPVRTFMGLTFTPYGGGEVALAVGDGFVVASIAQTALLWDASSGSSLQKMTSRAGFGGVSAYRNIAAIANSDTDAPNFGVAFYDMSSALGPNGQPISTTGCAKSKPGQAMFDKHQALGTSSWGTVCFRANSHLFMIAHDRSRKF